MDNVESVLKCATMKTKKQNDFTIALNPHCIVVEEVHVGKGSVSAPALSP